jgi:hypothetical protein
MVEPGSRRPSILLLLLVFAVFIAVVVWAGTAISTDDALWFLPVFSENASSYILYWDGGEILVEPGTAGYARMNEAFHEELTGIRAHPNGVGLSDVMLEHLETAGRLVEAQYAEPARIHSRYRFGASPVYYVPLSGYHAWNNRVFNFGRGSPLELDSTDQIMAAAEEIVVGAGAGSP